MANGFKPPQPKFLATSLVGKSKRGFWNEKHLTYLFIRQ